MWIKEETMGGGVGSRGLMIYGECQTLTRGGTLDTQTFVRGGTRAWRECLLYIDVGQQKLGEEDDR